MHHETTAHAIRPRRAAVLLLLLALLTAACGTRLSGEERAAARGRGGQAVAADERSVGDATAGGDDTSSLSPGSTVVGDDAGAVAQPDAGGGAAPDAGTGQPATTAPASGGGAVSAAGGGAPAATKEPITLGQVGIFSGPSGAAWKPMADMLQVWARDVNGRGGVDGHPVRIIAVDDGGDPARHFSAVRDLVENKKVLAFIGNGTSNGYSDAMRSYLEQRNIPVIGGSSTEKVWDESPVFFPGGTSQVAQTRSHPFAARALRPQAKRWGHLTCREAQGCKDGAAAWKQFAPQAGFQIVYEGEVSIAQPDFTAECLGARNANAEVLAIAVDPNSMRRLAQSCARQGFKGTYVLPSAVVASSQEGDTNLNGALGVIPNSPWMTTSNPGNAAMHAAVKKYAPNLALNMASPVGWGAGLMFEEAVKKAGGLGSPVDRNKLFEGLYKFDGETLGGVAPPLTFRRGEKKNNPCWFTVEFKDGKWTAVNGGRHTCP